MVAPHLIAKHLKKEGTGKDLSINPSYFIADSVRADIISVFEEFSHKNCETVQSFVDNSLRLMSSRPYFDDALFARNYSRIAEDVKMSREDDRLFLAAIFLKWSDKHNHGNVWGNCGDILLDQFGWYPHNVYRVSYIMKSQYLLHEVVSDMRSNTGAFSKFKDFCMLSILAPISSVDFYDAEKDLMLEEFHENSFKASNYTERDFCHRRATLFSYLLGRASNRVFHCTFLEDKFGKLTRDRMQEYVDFCRQAGIFPDNPFIKSNSAKQDYTSITEVISFKIKTT